MSFYLAEQNKTAKSLGKEPIRPNTYKNNQAELR